MEPVDPRMGGLLDGAGAGGPDELRSIVSRAGRRRTRLAALAAGLALATGGGIGYGVASATSGGSGQEIVATSPVTGPSSAAAGPLSANGSMSVGGSIATPVSKLQSLFTRQVGSIDIRGFLTSLPNPMPYQGVYSCFGGPSFQAEVSTPHMVGIVAGFEYQNSTAGPITYYQPALIGQAEGDPTAIVVAYTSSAVAQVRMDFASPGGARDEMAPVQGWSALAAPWSSSGSPPKYGTLTAFDHAGHVLSQVTVESAPKPVPGGSGTGSTGSGSTGFGTESGTVHAAGGVISSPPASVSTGSPSAPGNVAYPCRVPPGPVPPPTCIAPTTVKGANSACGEVVPYQTCSFSAGGGSASSGAVCTSPPVTPGTTSVTTVSPNSGSGG
jgi:hypothetical protein